MVISVFRSRIRDDNGPEFLALADRMLEIARAMPGFLSYKVFIAEDGERCSIVEFETAEQLMAWRMQPEHVEAQRVGRERYYEEYSLQVCEPVRDSSFTRSTR